MKKLTRFVFCVTVFLMSSSAFSAWVTFENQLFNTENIQYIEATSSTVLIQMVGAQSTIYNHRLAEVFKMVSEAEQRDVTASNPWAIMGDDIVFNIRHVQFIRNNPNYPLIHFSGEVQKPLYQHTYASVVEKMTAGNLKFARRFK